MILKWKMFFDLYTLKKKKLLGIDKILEDISNSTQIFTNLTAGRATTEQFVSSLETLTRDIDKQISLFSIVSDIPVVGEFIDPFILLLRAYVSRIPAIGYILSQVLVGPAGNKNYHNFSLFHNIFVFLQ